MKILHTSDWHLGKKLEGFSRIEEQSQFLNDLNNICNEKNIDILVIAGDIYDSKNPPVEAEKLYFKNIKKLSNEGNRLIIIIAGNHDNPEKLLASAPFAEEYGIICFGKHSEKKEIGSYGKWDVTESYEGSIVIKNNKNKSIFVNALPYTGEKELNEIFTEEEYSKKIGDLLSKSHNNNKNNLQSIIISHLFTLGLNQNENSSLGGSTEFNLSYFPKADYIALGHIHKSMKFKDYNAYYCGSPIEYRVSENSYDKKVLIKDFEIGSIEEILLKNYKPIKKYTAFSIEEAIEISEKLNDSNEWIYLFIETIIPLKNNEIREIKKNKNIIEIIPKIIYKDNEKENIENEETLNINEAFKKFYNKKYSTQPNEDILNIFNNLIEEIENETN